MQAIARGIAGFFRFWYGFIVGDDWTVAASIFAALIVTALLNQAHIVSWWLVPLTVILTVGQSLRRASRPRVSTPATPPADTKGGQEARAAG